MLCYTDGITAITEQYVFSTRTRARACVCVCMRAARSHRAYVSPVCVYVFVCCLCLSIRIFISNIRTFSVKYNKNNIIIIIIIIIRGERVAHARSITVHVRRSAHRSRNRGALLTNDARAARSRVNIYPRETGDEKQRTNKYNNNHRSLDETLSYCRASDADGPPVRVNPERCSRVRVKGQAGLREEETAEGEEGGCLTRRCT